jgi:aminopeptidase N
LKLHPYIVIVLAFTFMVKIDAQIGLRNAIDKKTAVSPTFSDLQNNYDVKFYFINIEVSNDHTAIKGNTSILLEPVINELDTLVFELSSSMVIDSLFVNDEAIIHYVFSDNTVKIPIPYHLRTQALLDANIFYNGSPATGGFFSGVSRRLEPKYNQWVTYTLSEPFQALTWFPCKQDLWDKADSAWVFITVDSGLMAGSNGLLSQKLELEDGKTRYEWKTKYPITYYLLSFAVGNYIDYSFEVDIPGTSRSLPVQNFLYNHPDLPQALKNDIDETRDLLLLYSDLLGVYPFLDEKYGHCMAPMGGGMEHQTMTTISHFGFGLLAHELAHQWFGNYVTCKTWQDIWINEGFASYLEYVAIEKLKSPQEAKDWIGNAKSIVLSVPEGSVFIDSSEAFNVNRIFSYPLSYKKGALILHMLRFELDNDVLFFDILKEFLQEYAFDVASGEDFLEFFNKKTGEDYRWFFDQWYYGKGFPHLLSTWSQAKDSLIIYSQQEPSSPFTPFFRMDINFKIIYTDGSEEYVRARFLNPEERFSFPIEKQIANVLTDPENIILKTSVTIEKKNTDQLFVVSPNPFNEKLNIKFFTAGPERTIILSSISGKKVLTAKTSSASYSQNLSNIKPGIYVLSIKEGAEEFSLKIVKTDSMRN